MTTIKATDTNRGLILAFLLAAAALAMPARAADHLDAPGLTPPGGFPALDLTDVFAFQSPECSGCTVLVMAVNGLNEPGVDAAFDRRGTYEFRIDADGDAIRDLTFKVFFKKRRDGRQRFGVNMQHPDFGRTKIVRKRDGWTTLIGEDPDVANGNLGIRAFAGMRDDPFFFDLPGFLELSFCSSNPAPDTFAGTNVGAIVLEIPNSVLAIDGQDIGVWADTRRRGVGQVDRMGRPAINTVLIPTNPINGGASLKDAFNAGAPASDQAQFRGTVLDTLGLLGNDAATAAALADALLPDILTLTLDGPTGFLNGRNLDDDVIDIELDLLTGGAIPSDCVDANDVPFLDSFPFLGEPHE